MPVLHASNRENVMEEQEWDGTRNGVRRVTWHQITDEGWIMEFLEGDEVVGTIQYSHWETLYEDQSNWTSGRVRQPGDPLASEVGRRAEKWWT